ncbi:MAG TPA: tRNA lysidine(34) synthetase TilS [Dehalococcoidia bacterium]|nr:tRNA lysidine(34) synthetase TilS [Dehalococcoidia bacterium]
MGATSPLAPSPRGGGRTFPSLRSRLSRFLAHSGALRPGERVLVALSGGPDSTALLVLLHSLRDEMGLELVAAHFDHGLRPHAETAADLEYCQDLARALGLPLLTGRGDTASHARERGLSLEEAARELRYRFLAQQAAQAGAGVVATGHTASDQAETVLLHLLRGSGLDGLAGMRPRAPWPYGPGPQLARPLLCLWREDTERCCRALGIVPRRDPTNLEPGPLRNRIRLRLLPLLRELNPRIEEALVRLASLAAQAVDFLEGEASRHWQEVAWAEAHQVRLDRRRLLATPPAIASRLLRRAYAHLAGPGREPEAVQVEQGLRVAARGRGQVSLPQGIVLEATAREVRLRRGLWPLASPLPDTPLRVPGLTEVDGWVFRAELVPPPASPRTASPYEAYLDADAVGTELTVTARRRGDRLRPLGLGGEKKLQDLLVDAKVPAEERDRVPIVRCRWGIAWVVGLRLDERAAVGPRTRLAVHLVAQPPASRGQGG